MPRYFLSENNVIPEIYFREVRYSGKHDTTLQWVRDGTVDLGVANSKVIDRMLAEEGSSQKEIRVLWETPYYSNYVWAVHPSTSRSTQIKIRDAFLKLSAENPRHKKILDLWNAKFFHPATIEDFLIIRKIVKQLVQE
jgi:phosphonate transport system substrate-binding protein